MFPPKMINSYYTTAAEYFPGYFFCLGAALFLFALSGFIRPLAVHSYWVRWTMSRFFRFHGILLVLGGIPLLHFRGTISGKILFAVGIITLITAPFIIIFPELFRQVFDETESTLTLDEKKTLVYADSFLRICISALLVFVAITHR
jgi:hypothetical protein